MSPSDQAGRLWPPGPVLPAYTPFRRLPEWEPTGRWMRDRPQLTWPDAAFPAWLTKQVIRLLLFAGLALAVATSGAHRTSALVVIGLGALTWAFLEWWFTWDLSQMWRRVTVVIIQFALIAAMIAVNPLAGLFAWSAYAICGTFFTGPQMIAAMAASATAMAAVQVGGWRRLDAHWGYSLAIFTFDVLVGVVFVTVAQRREAAVLARAATTRQLLQAQAENAALQKELVEQARQSGISDERARLARELHDTVAQGLVAIVTQLEAAGTGNTEQRVDKARDLARQSLRDARRAVEALSPVELETGGLDAALADLVPRWAALHDLTATVEIIGQPGHSAADEELVRICQEALSNVARHAAARRVVVSLTYARDEVVLDVGDDGRGFDPGGPGGHGLRGMAERARRVGGRLTVDSEPGSGAVISAAVPR